MEMKKGLLVFTFVLVLGSCATTKAEFSVNDNTYYVEQRDKYIQMIEANLTADMQINLDTYMLAIGDHFGYGAYYKDFKETVILKYQSAVEAHNEEYLRRQKQKDDEWVALSLKRIPGSKDWEVFQDKYNLKMIYSSMVHESNSVNRLRLEIVEKEMSAYIKDKNLVFNEEQAKWYKNVNSSLMALAFALNVNFGMNEAQFQSLLNGNLAKLNGH
jgi:hypothetical protein